MDSETDRVADLVRLCQCGMDVAKIQPQKRDVKFLRDFFKFVKVILRNREGNACLRMKRVADGR